MKGKKDVLAAEAAEAFGNDRSFQGLEAYYGAGRGRRLSLLLLLICFISVIMVGVVSFAAWSSDGQNDNLIIGEVDPSVNGVIMSIENLPGNLVPYDDPKVGLDAGLGNGKRGDAFIQSVLTLTVTDENLTRFMISVLPSAIPGLDSGSRVYVSVRKDFYDEPYTFSGAAGGNLGFGGADDNGNWSVVASRDGGALVYIYEVDVSDYQVGVPFKLNIFYALESSNYSDMNLTARPFYSIQPSHLVRYVLTADKSVRAAIVAGATIAEAPFFTHPTDASRALEGWYTDDAFSTPYVFGTPVNDDATVLWAQWTDKFTYLDTTLTGLTVAGLNEIAHTGDLTVPGTLGGNTIDAVKEGAFDAAAEPGYANILTLSLPSSVTVIGARAFAETGIRELFLSSGSALSIKNRAFAGCLSLTAATVSRDISNMEYSIFNGCTLLTEIVFNGDITAATFGTNVLPALKTVIFNGAVGTLQNVLSDCAALEALIFNSTVGTITSGSFQNLTALKKLTFKGNVGTINATSFSYCGVKFLTFEGEVGAIGESAFQHSGLLTLIFGGGVQTIKSGAFSYSSDLRTLAFRGDIENINGAFYSLSALREIAFMGRAGQINSALGTAPNVELITFSDVDTISSGAFSYMSKLKKVEFLGDVGYLSAGAFNDCVIEKLFFRGDVEGIGYSDSTTPSDAFNGTRVLDELTFGGEVGSINRTSGSYMFQYSTIRTLDIRFKNGSKITNAFGDLSNLEALELKGDIAEINSSFGGASKLETLIFEGDVGIINNSFGGSGAGTLTFKGTVTEINGGFGGTQMKSVVFDKDVDTITGGSFGSASKLETLIFEGDVGIINSSFGGSGAGTLTFKGTVTEINSGFGGTQMKSVVFDKDVDTITTYSFNGAAELKTLIFKGDVNTITVGSFGGAAELETLTFNGNVDTINNSSFGGASKLETLTFNGNVNTMTNGPFGAAAELKTLIFKGDVNTIIDGPFSGASKLETLIFEGDVGTIKSGSFSGASELKTLIFKGDVGAIVSNAFGGASKLETLTFNGSVTTIDGVFNGCSVMQTLEFNGYVGTIGVSAKTFESCSALTSVVFKGEVGEIGSNAFWNVTLLSSITFYDNVDKIDGVGGFLGGTFDVYFLKPLSGAGDIQATTINFGPMVPTHIYTLTEEGAAWLKTNLAWNPAGIYSSIIERKP